MARELSSSPASAEESTDIEFESLDIRGSIVTGIKWKIIAQVASEASRVIVTLVLARLLSPGDYGIAGMALVCSSFVELFADPGLGTALVQKRSLTEADRSTAFWANTGIGIVMTIGGILISGYVADAFGQPEVKNLFIVLSFNFLLGSVTITQVALLARNLSYRQLEIREIGATVAGAVAAIGVAVAGYGAWAIITNLLVFSVTSTALVWSMSNWRPRLMFSMNSLRQLSSFGFRVFGARTLTWGTMNMDNVLVGRFLGAAALGAYSIAYNVMFVPMTRIANPIAQVLSPAFARMQEDKERLERTWLESKRISNALLAPGFLICIVVAPDLVPVAFGSKWHAVVLPLQLLSVAGLGLSLVTLHYGILMALGKGGTLVWKTVIVAILTLSAFGAGVPFGLVGIAGFYAAARWILVPIDTWMTTRSISIDFWSTLWAGTSMLPVALLSAAASFGLRELLVAEHVPPAARLVVATVGFVAVYASFLRIVAPTLFKEARDVLRRRTAPAILAANGD